jgi:predicted DNA-binding helix-hairpin-helix protein
MHHQTTSDTLTRLTKMGDLTLYEPAGDQPMQERGLATQENAQSNRYQSRSIAECISHVSTPQGKKPILKTMITTACERNCYYCPFRAGRGQMRRETFNPDALAGAFDTLQRSKQVDGMFLSSGIIKGSVTTQDKIIDTAEIVRKKYNYRGYLHLKIMPGIEYDQLYRLMQLADRVSVNLEGPTQERLDALAPKKDFNAELLQMLKWVHDIREAHPHQKLAKPVTQFVVGAVGDTDVELLSITERLMKQWGIVRTYYSAFHPILHTPFENLPTVDPKREHRLYQASFLLRDYGWNIEEMSFGQSLNLRLDVDPKKAWADANLTEAPIEIMTASREELLRIPGFGPKAADAIVKARRTAHLTDLSQLRKLDIRAPEQASPYILLNGSRPPQQLTLF